MHFRYKPKVLFIIVSILLSSISNDGDYDEISRLFSKKALYDFVDENKAYDND